MRKERKGLQAERINRRRKKRMEEEQEQGEKNVRGQPPTHTANNRVRVKVRCTEGRERYNPGSKKGDRIF